MKRNKDRLKKIDELLEWVKKLPKIEDNDFKIEDGWVTVYDEKIYDVSDWDLK